MNRLRALWRGGALALALVATASAASAQTASGTPPAVNTGHGYQQASPTAIIGQVGGTGAACLIGGAVANCQLPVSGGGGGGSSGVSTVVVNPPASGVVSSKVICSSACTLTAWSAGADSTLSAAAYFIILVPATSDPGNGATPAGSVCYPASSGQIAIGASAIAETWASGLTMVASTACATIIESAHATVLHGDKY